MRAYPHNEAYWHYIYPNTSFNLLTFLMFRGAGGVTVIVTESGIGEFKFPLSLSRSLSLKCPWEKHTFISSLPAMGKIVRYTGLSNIGQCPGYEEEN